MDLVSDSIIHKFVTLSQKPRLSKPRFTKWCYITGFATSQLTAQDLVKIKG